MYIIIDEYIELLNIVYTINKFLIGIKLNIILRYII